MVHTKSAIAFTVLALGAASTLAAPAYEDYADELALREFAELYEALEARGIDLDEYDARDFDFDFDDYDARDLEDYDIREIIEEFDVDARQLDFGDFEERELFDFEDDLMEREDEPTSTSSSSSSTTPSATTTTITVKPTGKTFFGRKKKESKVVLVTTHKTPKSCKRPGLFSRIKNAFKKGNKKRSQLRDDKKNGKKSEESSSSSSSSASSTSASATPTTDSTKSADWAMITPPPRSKIPKGVKYSQKKTVGKDKVTTISRTVTAAPTPCPTKDASKKSKRDIEEFEDVFGREFSFDELD